MIRAPGRQQDDRAAGAESAAGKLASEAARAKAEADVQVWKAKLGVSEADLARQAALLTYATVTAPFDGTVSARNVDTGHYVMPPTSGTAMPPLFVVVRTDTVRVFVDVPETEAALVKPGQPATVRVPGLQDKEVAGTVARTSWALDATTRTLRAQIDLPNPAGELRPGMYSTTRLALSRPGGWSLPAGAVVTTDEQPFAVRMENGRGLKTPVKVGAKANGQIELLAKLTRPTPRGEPAQWEPITGAEEFLTARPAAWTDGAAVAVGP